MADTEVEEPMVGPEHPEKSPRRQSKIPTFLGTPATIISSSPAPLRQTSVKVKNNQNKNEKDLANLHALSLTDAASDSGIEEDKNIQRGRPSSGNKTIPRSSRPVPKQVSGSPQQSSAHTPANGTDSRSLSQERKPIKSKVGSFQNMKHQPGGGDVRISHQKQDYSTVQSKCGSKANLHHTPKGGEKKIESRKLEWSTQSKVGSFDKVKHRPGGGDVKIQSQKVEWTAQSRVGSMDKVKHRPGGGDKKIETQKLDFREKAQAKVGSKKNINHRPGGGEKQIENRKLDFKERATARTKHGLNDSFSPGLSPGNFSETSSVGSGVNY